MLLFTATSTICEIHNHHEVGIAKTKKAVPMSSLYPQFYIRINDQINRIK